MSVLCDAWKCCTCCCALSVALRLVALSECGVRISPAAPPLCLCPCVGCCCALVRIMAAATLRRCTHNRSMGNSTLEHNIHQQQAAKALSICQCTEPSRSDLQGVRCDVESQCVFAVQLRMTTHNIFDWLLHTPSPWGLPPTPRLSIPMRARGIV